MKKDKTVKKLDNISASTSIINGLKNFQVFLLMIVMIGLGFTIGIIIYPKLIKPEKRELHHTDMFIDETHYYIIEGRDGGVTIINYTLDSIKIESAKPQVIFVPDQLNVNP